MTTTAAFNFISLHSEGAVYLDPVKEHHLFIATRTYTKNTVICEFTTREISTIPSRFTIQAGHNKHIFLSPDHLQYVNHSCNPNAFFDVDKFQLVALKNIEEGEEITFFYPSSEWEMSEPFACNCGENNCLGTVNGSANLPKTIINQYRLTRFIQTKLNEDHCG